MKVGTFIFCHEQDFVLDSIKTKKYEDFGEHYYVFMGFNPTNKINLIENVIISKNLPDNIEHDSHCLQYCGWYSIYKNIDLNYDYLRLIDYDVDILTLNNTTKFKIKSGLSFDFNFYFDYGFKDCDLFKKTVESLFGNTIINLILKYQKNITQSEWFSIGDVLIDKNTFKEFMNWFYPLYQEIRYLSHFAHHFERYITIYCLLNDIEYEIKKDEIHHKQLKSHKYY